MKSPLERRPGELAALCWDVLCGVCLRVRGEGWKTRDPEGGARGRS